MSAKPLPFDPIARARDHWRDHGWESASAGMAAVTSVMRVQQIFLARVDETLRPLGLTFARYEALMLLWFSSRGSLPLSKIGERLQVHPSSVTNTIDRLERDGYVARSKHPTDGRATLAAITPAGRRVAKRATTAINRVFEDTGWTAAEHRDLFRLLRTLRVEAGDFEEE